MRRLAPWTARAISIVGDPETNYISPFPQGKIFIYTLVFYFLFRLLFPIFEDFGLFKISKLIKKMVRRSTNPDPEEIEQFIFSLYVNINITPKSQRRSTIQSEYELQSVVQSDEFRTARKSPKTLKKVVRRTLSTIEDAFAKSSKALGRSSLRALKKTLSIETET